MPKEGAVYVGDSEVDVMTAKKFRSAVHFRPVGIPGGSVLKKNMVQIILSANRRRSEIS